METEQLSDLMLQPLTQKEKINSGGGFLGAYAAACVIAYYVGYGAHAIYDKYIQE